MNTQPGPRRKSTYARSPHYSALDYRPARLLECCHGPGANTDRRATGIPHGALHYAPQWQGSRIHGPGRKRSTGLRLQHPGCRPHLRLLRQTNRLCGSTRGGRTDQRRGHPASRGTDSRDRHFRCRPEAVHRPVRRQEEHRQDPGRRPGTTGLRGYRWYHRRHHYHHGTDQLCQQIGTAGSQRLRYSPRHLAGDAGHGGERQ